MENVLKKIVEKKKEKVIDFKKNYSINSILDNIKKINNFIDFKKKIIERNVKKEISIIAEIKKASPSAGILVQNFDPLNIAKL